MLTVGQTIERFEVLGLIGRGGMARVYLVEHRVLGSRHVLKVLTEPTLAGSARLLREGQVQGSLRHPNIAHVTDVLDVGGAPALLMEWIDGPSLDDVLRSGRPGLPLVDALVPGVCAGLAAAHAAGVVHRDLKPGNVLLSLAGGELTPKVADFGLVKWLTPPHGEIPTSSGATMGTPYYMAPEQIRSTRDVDGRADVWALGVMLYELTTGSRPFGGSSPFAVLEAVVAGVYPPAREREPSLPDRVVTTIEACLQPLSSRAASIDQVRAMWGGAERGGVVSPADLAWIRRCAPSLHPRSESTPPASTWPENAWKGSTTGTRRGSMHNLPKERDTFVGRADDLSALAAAIDAGARQVTVVGIGGAGKTRLVTRFGWSRTDPSTGGVWFADLSEARTSDGVCAAVASALQVELGDLDPVEQLGHAIAARGRCLLLLDNAEQVVAAVRAAVDRWLDRAPEVVFVVTSRERLALPGEHVMGLEPLPPADAAALFVARSQAVNPRFAPDDPDVAPLVELLDGLPLAIELAAARGRAMTPGAMLTRMSERFRLLASAGGRPARHATLRGALDWSWDLLTDDEQLGLAQLSVFEGGFQLDMAEEVLSVGSAWPADVISSLVDKSLVRAVAPDRFDLLVSVRTYASERLDARGERAPTEARHGSAFATWAAHAVAASNRAPGASARRRLRQEVSNLRIAALRAAARGDREVAVVSARAAFEVYASMGPLSEASALGQALEAAPLDQVGRAWGAFFHLQALERSGLPTAAAYAEASAHAARAHDPELSLRLLLHEVVHEPLVDRLGPAERVATLARALGDPELEAASLRALASVAIRAGDGPRAHEALSSALAVARARGQASQEAYTLMLVGALGRRNGRLRTAQRAFDAAVGLSLEVGHAYLALTMQLSRGACELEAGDLRRAAADFDEAFRTSSEHGFSIFLLLALANRGSVALASGDAATARRLHSEAIDIGRSRDMGWLEAYGHGLLGRSLAAEGDQARARACWARALDAARSMRNAEHEATWRLDLGESALAEGALGEARQHIAEGLASLSGSVDGLLVAKLLCARARLEAAAGEPDAARDTLLTLDAQVAPMELVPTGDLARRLAAARAAVGDLAKA